MRALSDVDVTRMKELQAWLLALYLGFGFMASSGLYSSRCPLPNDTMPETITLGSWSWQSTVALKR
eukprot:scaffold1630_cov109-Isochrysis_galbana.AAC.1